MAGTVGVHFAKW